MTLATQPCPACNQLIHPIAGRCKHCKADLVAYREQQAAARQAAAQAQLRRTTKTGGAVPPPPSPQRADATPAPMHPAQAAQQRPPSHGGVPGPVYDPATGPSATHAYVHAPRPHWSRRWPLAVAVVAVLAIGLSIGMMADRWGSDDASAAPEKASGTSTPMMVPDHIPNPGGPTSKLMPKLPFGMKQRKPIPFNGKAPAVGMFAVALTDGVCTKLSSCGLLDNFSEMLCRELAQQMKDSDAAGKVRRGECHYNEKAAEACLGAIQSLSCTAKSADVMDWVTKAGSLTECTNAYTCK
jgi:hypothetical protein